VDWVLGYFRVKVSVDKHFTSHSIELEIQNGKSGLMTKREFAGEEDVRITLNSCLNFNISCC
jgi:hypothetical protein